MLVLKHLRNQILYPRHPVVKRLNLLLVTFEETQKMKLTVFNIIKTSVENCQFYFSLTIYIL